VLIFWHRPERRFQIFVRNAGLLPQLGGSPDEQAARRRVDVDGGAIRGSWSRRHFVELGMARAGLARVNSRVGRLWASVGRGVGDLQIGSRRVEVPGRSDLGDACSVHVIPNV
jgi:hypothetical protein